jgi:hypothetical protein
MIEKVGHSLLLGTPSCVHFQRMSNLFLKNDSLYDLNLIYCKLSTPANTTVMTTVRRKAQGLYSGCLLLTVQYLHTVVLYCVFDSLPKFFF